jgi:hypothetical protein
MKPHQATTATAKPSAFASPVIAPDRRPDPPATNVKPPAAKPATGRRALIVVRERFPGEAVTSIRYPAGARERVFLSGPHFDLEKDPRDEKSWFFKYLWAIPEEIDALSRKLGFDEFTFKVSLPHCRVSETWSTRHNYPIS